MMGVASEAMGAEARHVSGGRFAWIWWALDVEDVGQGKLLENSSANTTSLIFYLSALPVDRIWASQFHRDQIARDTLRPTRMKRVNVANENIGKAPSNGPPQCRICFDGLDQELGRLIMPCLCKGSASVGLHRLPSIALSIFHSSPLSSLP